MRPPRKVYMVGLTERAQFSGIPIIKSWIKEEKLVVKKQPERSEENFDIRAEGRVYLDDGVVDSVQC